MISTLQVVGNAASLEERLPLGHTLQVESPLVLLIGENGTGKSGFLRLLQSSMVCAKYFDVHSRSKIAEYFPLPPSLGREYVEIAVADVFKDFSSLKGKFSFYLHDCPTPSLRQTFLFYKDRFPDLAFDFSSVLKECHYHHRDGLWEDQRRAGYFIFTYQLEEIFANIQSNLCQDLPVNRWVFLAPSPAEDLYYQCFASTNPVVKTHGHDSLSQACIYSHFNFVVDHKKSYERDKSTGQHAKNVIEKFYLQVRTFFEEHTHPTGEFKPFTSATIYEKIPEEKRDSAKLIVLMDEPTLSLSYNNKYLFRDAVQEMTRQYAPRLQFFIATNDPVLIERTDALFLDFDKVPVESRRSVFVK